MEQINAGDTAWILVATALVMVMTPALAFFYGGMVRKKNLLSTINLSFITDQPAVGAHRLYPGFR
jgi:Amt family ammonium transporter